MKIDKTATVTGGGLYTLEIGPEWDICAEFTVDPQWLESGTVYNTVSISALAIDSTPDAPPPDPLPPDPEEPNYDFYGRDSMYQGLGGAPPYITGYPIGGPVTLLVITAV
jgi:hypothetical protein